MDGINTASSILWLLRVDSNTGDDSNPRQASTSPTAKPPGIHHLPSRDTSSFFSFLNTRHRSERVRRSILASTDSKDLYIGRPMLEDKSKTVAIITKLKEGIGHLDEQAVLGPCHRLIDEVTSSLRAADNPSMTIEDCATLSLQMETLRGLLTEYACRGQQSKPGLRFIQCMVENLEFVSRYMYMQQAHQTIVGMFTQEREQLGVDNPMFNRTISKKGTVESHTGLPAASVGGGVDAGLKGEEYFDDEGYLITTDVTTLSGYLKAKVAVCDLEGRGTETRGSYSYSRFARAHALCSFTDLLKNHNGKRWWKTARNPEIEKLLSRKACVNGARLFWNKDELSDFYAVQKDYLRDQHIIARSFSTLLSLDYSQSKKPAIQKKEVDRALMKQRAIEFMSIGTKPVDRNSITEEVERSFSAEIQKANDSKAEIKSDTKVADEKRAIVLKGKLKTRTGTAGAKIDTGSPLVKVNASVEKSSKKTHAKRYFTFIELMKSKFFDDDYKNKFRAQLADQGQIIKRELRSFWNQAPIIRNQKKASVLDQDIARLTEDFNAYSNLHAQKGPGCEEIIEEFHRRYGVQSTEECLKRMVVLTAWFHDQLSTISEKNKNTELVAKYKKQIAELEKLESDIHATGIPHRPDLFKLSACAEQDYFIKTKDLTIQGNVKGASVFSFFGLGSGLGFKINFRSLEHFNPLRCGQYINIEFSFGSNPVMNTELIKVICAQLNKYGDAMAVSDFLGEAPDPLASHDGKGVYSFKFFKPEDSGDLPSVKLFERISLVDALEISPAIHIPIAVTAAGVTTLKVGGSYTRTETAMIADKPSPNSLFLFGIHYLHGLFTSKIRKEKDQDEQKMQDCYWYKLLRDHEEVLKQLFLNLTLGSQHRLHDELAYLEKRFLKFASRAEKQEVSDTITALLLAARNYHSAKKRCERIEQEQLEPDEHPAVKSYLAEELAREHFELTLEKFKVMWRTIYDHWMMTREKSKAYGVPRYNLSVNNREPVGRVEKKAENEIYTALLTDPIYETSALYLC
ncbi:hypothetical protein AAKU67_002529 [Oxalobacteraceae bacterium GrIS 2.11]